MNLLVLYMISVLSTIYYPFTKGINIIDEVVVLLLLICWLFSFQNKIDKEFLFVIVTMLFFLTYSLIKRENVWQATLLDFMLFFKPFICFFASRSLSFKLSKKVQKKIANILLISGIYCIIQIPFLQKIYDNTATYYQCCMYCGLNYLFFSSKKKSDYIIAIFILSSGLFSVRAKYFTEFIFFIYVFIFLKSKIKLRLKYIIGSIIVGLMAVYVNQAKITHYLSNSDLVRTKFYYTVPEILVEYFPLGPGFGTYNTEGAARYYSPIYNKYGFSSTWGTRQIDYKTESDFLRDTFYPAIAQFGIVGYSLFILFWIRRWKSASNMSLDKYKFFIIFFCIEIVQNIAANAFTSADGVSILMILGILSKCDKSLVQTERCSHKELQKNTLYPEVINDTKPVCLRQYRET